MLLGLGPRRCAGQITTVDRLESNRLTVDPRTMATGTVNPAAGTYRLDFVPEAVITVPPQCVGAHRCPLYVQLQAGDVSAQLMAAWLGPVATKYGLLVLTTTEFGLPTVDAALQEVLRRFAIDPAKIAIVGRAWSASEGMQLGGRNMPIFSRVGAMASGGANTVGVNAETPTTEFIFDESYEAAGTLLRPMQDLRKIGHPVMVVLALRGAEQQVEDYDFVGHWLQQSWAIPDPTQRPAPAVVADPLPLLTPDVLRQMTAFWTRFLHEPDSIWRTARRAHLREVAVPLGSERAVAWLTDMSAMAAVYPSVAAALAAAGLTGEQHDAYRVALLSALASRAARGTSAAPSGSDSLDSRSPLGQNVAFVEAHADLLEALAQAGVEHPEVVTRIGRDVPYLERPEQADSLGPLGIWRTP